MIILDNLIFSVFYDVEVNFFGLVSISCLIRVDPIFLLCAYNKIQLYLIIYMEWNPTLKVAT